MREVYFSLGSNVGDRQQYLRGALAKLRAQVKDLRVSSLYRTEPWGKVDQPWFLNLCAAGRTSLPPLELLSFIKSIEAELGRTHTEKWGPREIDIDILFYGGKILKLPTLKIPHPRLAERAFVLIPLREIAADFVHPVLKKTVFELTEKISPEGIKRLNNE